jgi:hypothetical protein
MMLSSGNSGVDRAMIAFRLLEGANFVEDVPPIGGTLVQVAAENGMLRTLHFAAAKDASVSSDDVVQCLLAIKDPLYLCCIDESILVKRLITLVAAQQGIYPSKLMEIIIQQIEQKPQRHRDLPETLRKIGRGLSS